MEAFKSYSIIIINYLREMWTIPFARNLAMIIATAMVTHWFDSRKQRKEQQQKFKSVLGEKIANALGAVRDVVVSTRTYEILTEDGTIPTDNVKDINAFRNFPMYPSFMNDKESLLEFCLKISSLRSAHEQYLDLKSASYLYALEKYLQSLALYISKNQLGTCLPLVGCFVIIDIQKWEKSFDVHLVRQINRPHYKLFSRHGIKWSIAKWYVEKNFLEKTQLHQVMQGKQTFPVETIATVNEREEETVNA